MSKTNHIDERELKRINKRLHDYPTPFIEHDTYVDCYGCGDKQLASKAYFHDGLEFCTQACVRIYNMDLTLIQNEGWTI